MSTAELMWGSTSLIDDHTKGREWWIETSADGTNWGNPEAVVTAIRSHLQDGSLASVTSNDNRQATISIRVLSQTYEGLAQGEAALVAESQAVGYSTLTWSPNRDLAVPIVFDVVYATPPSRTFENDWDLSEVKRAPSTVMSRAYVLTLTCLPFGRDEELTTLTFNAPAAPEGGRYTAVIDACTSTTGWNNPNGIVQMDSTAEIGGVYAEAGAAYQANLVRDGVFSLVDGASTRYVSVDWSEQGVRSDTPSISAYIGPNFFSLQLMPIASVTGLPQGLTRTIFAIPEAIGSSARFLVFYGTGPKNYTGVARTLIHRVERTNFQPLTSSLKEQYRSAVIGGSARTPVSLKLSEPILGELGGLTMVYSRRATSAFQPPLRPWASDPGIEDTTTISGAYNPGSFQALVPARIVTPASYNLIAFCRGPVGRRDITVDIRLYKAGNALEQIHESQVAEHETVPVFFGSTGWRWVDLGTYTLPPVGVSDDSDLQVGFSIQGGDGTFFDEVWPFDIDNGVLSIVDTADLDRLEIRAADLNDPEQSYWAGYPADAEAATGLVRADYRALGGEHVFYPGPMDLFTACGSEQIKVEASFYRRHLSSVSPA